MAIAAPTAPSATFAESPSSIATSVRAPQLPASRVATTVQLPELPEHIDAKSFDAQSLLRETLGGKRLEPEAALWLLEHADTEAIREAADVIRLRRYPDGRATFIIDRNINYTNACVIKCTFCAFYRLPGSPEAYLRSMENIIERVEEAIAQGATQIMFQGGHDPDLRIEYYENLFRTIKARYDLTLHSLSPSEVHHIARYSRLSIAETLARLKAAGLDSLPGGGAEILTERVKREISPLKNSAAMWIEIMDEAHRQGLRTTGTMMLGHVDTLRDRVEHLVALRDSQDRAHATLGNGSGYRAFIPWTYQPDNTVLGRNVPGRTSSEDYLRTLAVSRLLFDNIDHVQGSWLTVGKLTGQNSLRFGADDLGSIMLEENVVSAAGVVEKCMTNDAMISLIHDAGRLPARRDTTYRLLETFAPGENGYIATPASA
jgi:cyclic dehypoxanthinyl futalosine synthase